MPVNTQFPFYDFLYELLEPHLPMIVNDLAGNIVEETNDGQPYTEETFTHIIDPNGENDDSEEMDDEVYEQDEEEWDESDDTEEDDFVGLSFGRGCFPDTKMDENVDIAEQCDYEFVIKPFFTIKPYLLLGLHNHQEKVFTGEIYDVPEFQPVELLEKFADMVTKVFPSESEENQIFLLTEMAHIALEELILFDEPPTTRNINGEMVEKVSPYFTLDNVRLYEYLIHQKRS